ncbi:MAG: PIN domain-containing protein [Verrucomicrobia subdivision 3 bacterium]|nr:PIN domain-containing protein [Limisphaerales bacterium]
MVLDACVLANFGVCDLLLKLAERPRQYLPVWSTEILDEVRGVHVDVLDWPEKLADSFQLELRKAFPQAAVDDYGHIVPTLTNDEKDRHVLAAAVRAGSFLILTFNTKDFPEASLAPWSIEVSHPDDYLLVLYAMEPSQVVSRIAAIAAKRGLDEQDVLLRLGKVLPKFAGKLLDDLELS